MSIWLTKYALSRGIEEAEFAQAQNCGGGLIIYDRKYYRLGEWHQTKEEAVARANEMRDEKIVSLRAQLAALEILSF